MIKLDPEKEHFRDTLFHSIYRQNLLFKDLDTALEYRRTLVTFLSLCLLVSFPLTLAACNIPLTLLVHYTSVVSLTANLTNKLLIQSDPSSLPLPLYPYYHCTIAHCMTVGARSQANSLHVHYERLTDRVRQPTPPQPTQQQCFLFLVQTTQQQQRQQRPLSSSYLTRWDFGSER